MKLVEASEDQVVRHRRNGHYYRFVRKEGRRVRIRPLELFPNGLLQEKTTDTIVEPDLEVDLVGEWNDQLFVETRAGKGRSTYEKELEKRQAELVVLEAEALTIDPKGRGSHANKVKAVAGRVAVLERGLADKPDDVDIRQIEATDSAHQLHVKAKEMVLLPSGRPGKLLKIERKGTQHFGRVVIKGNSGQLEKLKVDLAALVPATHRRQASVA